MAKKVIKIWFLLENLNLCDSLYKFRYITFKKIVDLALKRLRDSDNTDLDARKQLILKELLRLTHD